jgi:hypothetical protein
MTRLLPFAAPPPRGKAIPAAFIVFPGRVCRIPPNSAEFRRILSRPVVIAIARSSVNYASVSTVIVYAR